MTEKTPQNREKDGKFPKGVSGNPAGRPKGSKNRVTLLKLAAEEAARERNSEKIQKVLDAIINDALAGDTDMRKLVWNAVMSKGVSGDPSQAKEKAVIQVLAHVPPTGAPVEKEVSGREPLDGEYDEVAPDSSSTPNPQPDKE